MGWVAGGFGAFRFGSGFVLAVDTVLIAGCGAAGGWMGARRCSIGSVDAMLDLALFRGSGGFCYVAAFLVGLLYCF